MTEPETGWPRDAVELLHRAYEQHGGWSQWEKTRRISFTPVHVRGPLMLLKGCGSTFPLPPRVDVFPHDCRSIFSSYPDEQHRGVFERNSVRIERVDDDSVIQSNSNHRETFRGWAKNRRWSPMDALYFFGYALWHYHTLPFTLGAARFVRLRHVREHGHLVSVVDVEFPPDVPTHSTRQSFNFDENGRLYRHDYVADVISTRARGAHYWSCFKDIQGVPIACIRHVQMRLGGYVLPLTVLRAELADVEVELGK